jgi:hypothetical protein
MDKSAEIKNVELKQFHVYNFLPFVRTSQLPISTEHNFFREDKSFSTSQKNFPDFSKLKLLPFS